MCNQHSSTDLTRRGFAGLAALGAGMALLPAGARAALGAGERPTVFAVQCIDYRFVADAQKFFTSSAGAKNFDLVSLAGASLAGIKTDALPNEEPAFWEQVAAARKLHPAISKVIVLDHLTCGAYKVAFPDMKPDQESAKHQEVAEQVYNRFQDMGLPSEFWLLNDQTHAITPLWPPVRK
jgi:hypothetical protein